MASLDGSETPSHRLKLNRALEHLGLLQATVIPWANSDPCSVVGQCEVESEEQIWRLRAYEEPRLDRIRVLVGDALHNLRQSLDHLAHSLAWTVRETDPEDTSSFPIAGDPKDFRSSLGRGIAPVSTIPPELIEALENVQPYNGGDYLLLLALKELHDRDKHREPTVVAGGAAAVETLIQNIHLMGGIQLVNGGPAEDGEDMLIIRGRILNENPNVDLRVASDVIFGVDCPIVSRQPVFGTLEALRRLIATEVFPSLEPFLRPRQQEAPSTSTEKG